MLYAVDMLCVFALLTPRSLIYHIASSKDRKKWIMVTFHNFLKISFPLLCMHSFLLIILYANIESNIADDCTVGRCDCVCVALTLFLCVHVFDGKFADFVIGLLVFFFCLADV